MAVLTEARRSIIISGLQRSNQPRLQPRKEAGRAMSPAYFTNISASGPVRYGQLPGSIGVLEALDKPMPIGIAS
jgi:hypothetical protein